MNTYIFDKEPYRNTYHVESEQIDHNNYLRVQKLDVTIVLKKKKRVISFKYRVKTIPSNGKTKEIKIDR